MIMKIGLIADIHSNLAAFRAVLEDMPRVDELICAGDLVGYAAQPNEVIELARSKRVRTVMGNHDYASITRDVRGFTPIAAEAALWTSRNLEGKNSDHLRSLPQEMTLARAGKIVYVVHGSPRDPLSGYVFPDIPNRALLDLVGGIKADVIVFGHTHVPMRRVVYGKLVLNPGGVGQPRDRDPRASYMVLRLNGEIEVEHRRVKYEIDKTAKLINSCGLPSELAARLYYGW